MYLIKQLFAGCVQLNAELKLCVYCRHLNVHLQAIPQPQSIYQRGLSIDIDC